MACFRAVSKILLCPRDEPAEIGTAAEMALACRRKSCSSPRHQYRSEAAPEANRVKKQESRDNLRISMAVSSSRAA